MGPTGVRFIFYEALFVVLLGNGLMPSSALSKIEIESIEEAVQRHRQECSLALAQACSTDVTNPLLETARLVCESRNLEMQCAKLKATAPEDEKDFFRTCDTNELVCEATATGAVDRLYSCGSGLGGVSVGAVTGLALLPVTVFNFALHSPSPLGSLSKCQDDLESKKIYLGALRPADMSDDSLAKLNCAELIRFTKAKVNALLASIETRRQAAMVERGVENLSPFNLKLSEQEEQALNFDENPTSELKRAACYKSAEAAKVGCRLLAGSYLATRVLQETAKLVRTTDTIGAEFSRKNLVVDAAGASARTNILPRVQLKNIATIKPDMPTPKYMESKEFLDLPSEAGNVVSRSPKPFQYAEDVEASGGGDRAFIVGGVNPTEIIQKIPTLTGAKLDDLTIRAKGTIGSNSEDPAGFQPPFANDLGFRHSGPGWLKPNESMRVRLAEDNTYVLSKGLNHQKIAEPLLQMEEVIERALASSRTSRQSIEFQFNGRSYSVRTQSMPGGGDKFQEDVLSAGWRSTGESIGTTQGSLFNDHLFSNYAFVVSDSSGNILRGDALTPQLIHRYGFYQGGEFRMAPSDIINFFHLSK